MLAGVQPLVNMLWAGMKSPDHFVTNDLLPWKVSRMSPDSRLGLGRYGEQVAMGYLCRQGYQIKDKNWRCYLGEIDVVAVDRGTLVFVEVRARQGDAYGSPEESVVPAKQTRLVHLAETYLQGHPWPGGSWRIDVVAIEFSKEGKVKRLNHIVNAVGG